MIVILISWLFNGFLLGLMYLLAMMPFHKQAVHSMDWIIFGYGITTVLMLSGISKAGIYFLRLYIGCRVPVASERQKIEPLLLEVLSVVNQIKKTNYRVDKLEIMLVNSKVPDSQAIGGNTILLVDGLLVTASDDELKAVIAHELGHLYNRDSFILPILIFGGLPTRIVIWLNSVYAACRKLLSSVVGKFGKKGLHLMPVIAFIPLIIFLPVIILNWVARWLLDISLCFMCRQYAYKADKFANDVGYKEGLIRYLETIHIITKPDGGLWERVSAAHPAAMKRIGQLEKQ